MSSDDYNNMIRWLGEEKIYELDNNIKHGGAFCAHTVLTNYNDISMIYIAFMSLENKITNIDWTKVAYYITIFISNSLLIYNPMGIFKASRYKNVYYGLSISLHAYAATVALEVNNRLRYMITSPNYNMSKILFTACKKYDKKFYLQFPQLHDELNVYKRYMYIKSIVFMKIILQNINNESLLKTTLKNTLYLSDIYSEIIKKPYDQDLYIYDNYPLDYLNYTPLNCKVINDDANLKTIKDCIFYFFGSEKFITDYISRDKLFVIRKADRILYNKLIGKSKIKSVDIVDKLIENPKFFKRVPEEFYIGLFKYRPKDSPIKINKPHDGLWMIHNSVHQKPDWWDIKDTNNKSIPCFVSFGLSIIIKARDLYDIKPFVSNKIPVRNIRRIK